MQVHAVILASEYDPQLDVPFYRACKADLAQLCGRPLSLGRQHAIGESITELFFNRKSLIIALRCTAIDFSLHFTNTLSE